MDIAIDISVFMAFFPSDDNSEAGSGHGFLQQRVSKSLADASEAMHGFV
jgi:hypothetical protein